MSEPCLNVFIENLDLPETLPITPKRRNLPTLIIRMCYSIFLNGGDTQLPLSVSQFSGSGLLVLIKGIVGVKKKVSLFNSEHDMLNRK